MDAQTGKNEVFFIERKIHSEICQSIKRYRYETGGIIGIDKSGVIAAFQLDKIAKPHLYEYQPDINFLNEVINGCWSNRGIKFAGFIHSHLHNNDLSRQDELYAKEILKVNETMGQILIGVINLSLDCDPIRWYVVSGDETLKVNIEY